MPPTDLYSLAMDVGITDLRANLAECLRRVADGEELVITDRGRPVARLVPPGRTTDCLHDLIAAGIVTPATRKGARRRSAEQPRAHLPDGISLSDEVVAMRDEHR
jgi:prevent-host-death family protein